MEPKDKSAKDGRGFKPTMRDKAAKTAQITGKVSRKRRFVRIIGKPFRPIGRLLVKIERWKPIHIIGLVIVPRYFRNSWKELRLVVWPNRRETRRLTTAVLIFAVIFGVMIAIVDYGLDKLFKKIILKQ
jgi:preprotein translocase subunit SecE